MKSLTEKTLLNLISIAATMLWSAVVLPAHAVTPRDFGGKGDVVELKDGAMAAQSNAFHSNSANFMPADAGKAIVVTGAGPGGGALITKIQSVNSGKQLVLESGAETTVANAVTYYGTDDTSAIRKCVYEGTTRGGECTIIDGVTFMVSNTTSTIAPFGAGNNPIHGGTIGGQGRIIFAPQGKIAGGTNDRLFYLTSQETRPMRVSGAITKGATSFRAESASDAATLSSGDWVLITERDSVVKDHVYADWVQVSSVAGSTVQVSKPFRMAFPGARPWAGPPSYWGLSFRKVSPVTSNLTIHGVVIVIPKVTGAQIVGIATRDTRGTTISNVTCQDASGNCFAGYMDQGMIFQDNNIIERTYAEFAAEVDISILRNHFNKSGSGLNLPGPPTSGGLEFDFGSGFGRVEENVIGPSKQVCISLYPGIHDTIIAKNTCDPVTFGSGAACIMSRGGYRLTIVENTCMGSAEGRGVGIDVGDATNLQAPMLSDGNQISRNRVEGFASHYACGVTRLKTDTCDRR